MFTFLLFIKIKDKFVLSCLKNTPFGLRVTYWACFSFCMFTNDFLCIQSNSHFFTKKRDPTGEALGLKSCKKLHALKNKLHRQHIAHRSRRDRQEHIALVKMKQDHRDDRNKLGNSVRSRKKRDVFQAIDNRHSEDCRRERFPEIGDISGCFSDEKKERSNYNKRTGKRKFRSRGNFAMREEKVLWEPRRAVPIDARADVCVCGGGGTGVFAAVRSARLGCSVILCEETNILGGTAVRALLRKGGSAL